MARNTTFNLAPPFEKEKLTMSDNNYADWVRSLKIIFRSAKKEYILQAARRDAPGDSTTENQRNVYQYNSDESIVVQCLRLSCTESMG